MPGASSTLGTDRETLLLDVILPRVDDLILCKFVPLMKGPPNLIHGFAIKMPRFRCHLLDIETALLCHKRSHNEINRLRDHVSFRQAVQNGSIVAVLLELLDQYMMGGVQPTRDDLDHVFLRFG